MGGSASLLICMFLGPKFIDYLRLKEFGQQIREEGPAGHHGKAGTPTMGGLAIFIAIAVPFLILSEYRAAQPRGARHGARDGRARVRGRHHQAAPAPLARRVGEDEAARSGDRGHRAVDRGEGEGGSERIAQVLGGRRERRARAGVPGAHLPRARRRHERREPHRRPGRPRGGLRGDRAAHLHGDDLHHARPAGPGAAERLPRRRLRGLPVVQLVPGVGVHGGHRVARVRRGDRGARGRDEDRDPPDRDRRDLRDRGAVRGDPGVRLPALPKARVPDGARSTTTSSWRGGRRPRSSCASGSSPPSARRSGSRSTSRRSPAREAAAARRAVPRGGAGEVRHRGRADAARARRGGGGGLGHAGGAGRHRRSPGGRRGGAARRAPRSW